MSFDYLRRLLSLWICGRIPYATVRYALRDRPAAVAARGGNFFLDAKSEREFFEP